jgi:hypothetical protein
MPEIAKLLTLTIDGKAVAVPEGTTVLQACERALAEATRRHDHDA